jgi:shikimate dehydrogenase
VTRHVALIGNPLKRPHSAVMHNAAFAAHDIDATYELAPIEPDEVGSFFDEARGPDWLGFGVTAPYKQVAMTHLDEVEPDALAIGAVNNGVRRDDGSLVGFNTDAGGFISAVEATGFTVSGNRAVVLGAGGAARAVVWALLDAGAESVTVANRTKERADALARDLARFGSITTMSNESPELPESLASVAIAVNATTVGMTDDTVVLDVSSLSPDALVFDLVYVPPDTPLLRAASKRGLRVCNGMEMLIRQGEIAFERWTGIGSTADIMRRALNDWLSGPEGVSPT